MLCEGSETAANTPIDCRPRLDAEASFCGDCYCDDGEECETDCFSLEYYEEGPVKISFDYRLDYDVPKVRVVVFALVGFFICALFTAMAALSVWKRSAAG